MIFSYRHSRNILSRQNWNFLRFLSWRYPLYKWPYVDASYICTLKYTNFLFLVKFTFINLIKSTYKHKELKEKGGAIFILTIYYFLTVKLSRYDLFLCVKATLSPNLINKTWTLFINLVIGFLIGYPKVQSEATRTDYLADDGFSIRL